jgi:4,5-dihydroxyphthalate decarboxylase
MALVHYDRHIPFFEGSVGVEGVALTVLCVGQEVPHRDGGERHQRLLAGEFDIGEMSFASYLMARDRGARLTAVPVFPRRLFSQSRIYVNSAAGINSPADLVGKRMGLNTFQMTPSVLTRDDLQQEYGVPWREIIWVPANAEAVPYEPGAGIRVERPPAGVRLDEMLLSGQIQAVALPHPPKSISDGDPRLRRLFADSRQEERDYYRRNGWWPIIHLLVVQEQVNQAHPWLAAALLQAFERAKEAVFRLYDDPNWSRLAWGRQYLEDELAQFGGDPWRNGLASNRPNIERFIGYTHEQGLISQPMSPESLFAETMHAT